VFNDESFAELAVRMQRWYNVEIDIRDAALLQKRLTGNFEKESVQQALDALKISLPFKYEFNGNRIIIHK
jgi:ferric-dicitrate binding protein FerR (iron transport regulator)